MLSSNAFDIPVKSQRSDDKAKRFRCKAHKYEGMRRTYRYAAMREDEVQHSRWIFNEVVNLAVIIMPYSIRAVLNVKH